MLTHSEEDARIVAMQLGRPVRGRWAVVARCHLDVPMAIENHPRLDDGSPFPTLFWLTCPVLTRRASRLESSGFMADLTQRLERDGGLRERLAEAIAHYRARRDRHDVVDDAGSPPGGGPERVKCLHAHLAHQITDGPNPVGALTLAAAGWPDCRVRCVTTDE